MVILLRIERQYAKVGEHLATSMHIFHLVRGMEFELGLEPKRYLYLNAKPQNFFSIRCLSLYTHLVNEYYFTKADTSKKNMTMQCTVNAASACSSASLIHNSLFYPGTKNTAFFGQLHKLTFKVASYSYAKCR
jgi:hypothetical protein